MKRRAVAVLMAALLPVLAACGKSNELSQPEPQGEVTVTGEFNKVPEVKWSKDFAAGDLTAKVLIEGKGEKVTQATKSIDVNYYLASAEGTPEQAYSTYATGATALTYEKVEGYPAAWNELFSGKYTIGSRVLITGWAQNTFGEEGFPTYGLGRNDSAIFVVDIVKASPPPPTAAVDKVAKVTEVQKADLPTISTDPKNWHTVTGMNFTGVPDHDNNGDVLIRYIHRGKGAKLTAKSTVSAHYYGSLYGSKTPFDSSFKTGKPADFPLDGVIQGWKDGLTGVPVGSRVILGIPSRYGYGEGGSAPSIPANAYLYFYVEVVSAK